GFITTCIRPSNFGARISPTRGRWLILVSADSSSRSAVEIRPCWRQLGAAFGGVLAGHDLINAGRVVVEGERDAGQVGHPEAIALGADHANGLVLAGRQPPAPVPCGQVIVLAPIFDVVHFEAARFEGLACVADVVELAAGKNVLENQPLLGADAAETGLCPFSRAGDAMVEEDATIAEERINLAEIDWVVLDADVLVHADAGDFVVLAVERGVVTQLDLHPVFQTQAADLFSSEIELRLRERHAVGSPTVALGRMAHEASPAPAHSEHALAG